MKAPNISVWGSWRGVGMAWLIGMGSVLVGSGRADDLPKVSDVEFQPLSAQVRRVVESLDFLGQPLPDPVKRRIERAIASTDEPAAIRSLQDALDSFCLIGVEVNPESRV